MPNIPILSTVLQKSFKKQELSSNSAASKLTLKEIKTPQFHIISKVHNPNIPGRPAVKERKANDIPMGVHSAAFWANLFLYSYEEEYMSSLISSDKIKVRYFHSTNRFIGDLCAVNDGGEFGKFICDIYPKWLELKVEHQSDHATFLNLGITIKERTFLYKLFDKKLRFIFNCKNVLYEKEYPSNYFLFSNQR